MPSDATESSPIRVRRGWDRRQKVTALVATVCVGAIGALLVVGLLNQGVNTSINAELAAGRRPMAPSFALPVLTGAPGLPAPGDRVTLAQLRGHPVVLNIWASWCIPCAGEAPVLQSLWDHYRHEGVYVLGVDVNDLQGDAQSFHQRYGLTYPTIRDGSGEIMAAYGSTGVPENFIIDRQGRIAATLRSPLSDSGASANVDSFAAVIDAVVSER